MIAGVAAYGIGKIAHAETFTDIAFHTTEALAISTVANTALGGVLGRSRPFVSNGKDPRDFHFGKGFGNFDYGAFPSLHASAGFSAATVIASEVHHRWPGATWYVAPPLYALAAMPATARVHLGRHWASDIVAGAFLGTMTGLKVVQYHHSHPRNALDRCFLSTTVAPNEAGGVAVGTSITS